jgi:hypothetical protein
LPLDANPMRAARSMNKPRIVARSALDARLRAPTHHPLRPPKCGLQSDLKPGCFSPAEIGRLKGEDLA